MNFYLLFLFSFCFAEIQRGDVYSYHHSGFSFLGKFCVDSTLSNNVPSGRVSISLHFHRRDQSPPPNMELQMFNEEQDSWPLAVDYKTDCFAAKKMAMMAIPVKLDGKGNFLFEMNLFNHGRPKFLYFALVNCQTVYGISYSIHWTSAGSEFGINEQGLLFFHSVFLYSAAGILAVYMYDILICFLSIYVVLLVLKYFLDVKNCQKI